VSTYKIFALKGSPLFQGGLEDIKFTCFRGLKRWMVLSSCFVRLFRWLSGQTSSKSTKFDMLASQPHLFRGSDNANPWQCWMIPPYYGIIWDGNNFIEWPYLLEHVKFKVILLELTWMKLKCPLQNVNSKSMSFRCFSWRFGQNLFAWRVIIWNVTKNMAFGIFVDFFWEVSKRWHAYNHPHW